VSRPELQSARAHIERSATPAAGVHRLGAYDAAVDPEPAAEDNGTSRPDGSDSSEEAPPGPSPDPENAAFTFEGQIERLQRFVVGINRRGGRQKKIAQVLVVGGLGLLAAMYVGVILWGIFG